MNIAQQILREDLAAGCDPVAGSRILADRGREPESRPFEFGVCVGGAVVTPNDYPEIVARERSIYEDSREAVRVAEAIVRSGESEPVAVLVWTS